MEAPKCKLCDKRHYGLCVDAVVPAEPIVRKRHEQPAKRSSDLPRISKELEEALARIESLEDRMTELESRKKYMRDYQRRKRADA